MELIANLLAIELKLSKTDIIMKIIRLFLVTIIIASLVHTLPMNAQSSQNITIGIAQYRVGIYIQEKPQPQSFVPKYPRYNRPRAYANERWKGFAFLSQCQ